MYIGFLRLFKLANLFTFVLLSLQSTGLSTELQSLRERHTR